MRKLDILFVSEYFYPRAAGGEVWSWELCTALAARGHNVTVITCRHDDSPAEEQKNGVRILRPVRTTENVNRRFKRYNAMKELVAAVKEHVEHNNITVLHIMAYAGISTLSAYAREKKIPSILSVHSYFGEDWKKIPGLGPWLIRHFNVEQSSIRRSLPDSIHVPSAYLKKKIGKDTGKRNITVIHNWLPDRFPKPKKLKDTVLFVGSLEQIKNPLACIPVAKRLGLPLLVIGSGSLEKELRDAATREGVRLTLKRKATREETLSYIGGARLLLVPSVTESFSLVALEAVAQGTSVSGTPVGVLPELPDVVRFPPKHVPARLPTSTQRRIRTRFSKVGAVLAFERLYRSLVKQ